MLLSSDGDCRKVVERIVFGEKLNCLVCSILLVGGCGCFGCKLGRQRLLIVVDVGHEASFTCGPGASLSPDENVVSQSHEGGATDLVSHGVGWTSRVGSGHLGAQMDCRCSEGV
jgi:hypothetical protein